MKRSPLLILALTLFIDLLGFGLILPLLPVYITHYGGKPWVGGALLASFSVMQFLFSPIWGRASDRYGRRPLILISLIGSGISFLAFGFAPNLLVLFLARVAAGILSAASLPTAQAYIADVTTPEKRASGMAVLGASFGAGFALGPVVSAYASQISVFGRPPLATPAYVAAALCFANFIWAFFMLPESHFDRDGTAGKGKGLFDVFPAISEALHNPAISAQLTVFTFATFAFTAVEASFSWLVILRFQAVTIAQAKAAWLSAHAGQVWESLTPHLQQPWIEKAQAAISGHIFAIVGVTIILVQVAVIRGLASKVGENKLVVLGSGVLVLTLLGIAFAPQLWIIYVLSAGIAIGNGISNPSLNALITQAAGPKERGTLSGVQQGLGSMARIIAPPINNTLVAVHPAPLPIGCLPFLSSSILMAISFALSLRLKPLPKSSEPAPSSGGIGH